MCQVGVKFSIDSSIRSRSTFNFKRLEEKVKQAYLPRPINNQLIELELVKAYVRPNAYIIVATAVVSSKRKEGEPLSYYRASEVDGNLANLDSEYQLALNSVVMKAIKKAVIGHQKTCSST